MGDFSSIAQGGRNAQNSPRIKVVYQRQLGIHNWPA